MSVFLFLHHMSIFRSEKPSLPPFLPFVQNVWTFLIPSQNQFCSLSLCRLSQFGGHNSTVLELKSFGGPHILRKPVPQAPPTPQLVSQYTYQTPSENRAHRNVKDLVLEHEEGREGNKVQGRTGGDMRPNCFSSALGWSVSNASLTPLSNFPLWGLGWGGIIAASWDGMHLHLQL